MGLTVRVQNFFINKIFVALNSQLEKITENVNQDKVKALSLEILCKKHGAENLVSSWQALEAEEKVLKNKKDRLEEETASIIEKASGKENNSYYRRDSFSSLQGVAKELFEAKAMLELYPKIVPQIKEIEDCKQDVEGAVLLATTEPKLLATLNQVLNNYGGDISKLMKKIPQA